MTRADQPREDVAALLRAGATYQQIRDQLRVSTNVIAATRRAYSIPTAKGYGYRPTPEKRGENERQALCLLLAGATIKEVAARVGISGPTIVKLRRDAGLPPSGNRGKPPTRTVRQTLALYCEPYGDGHVRWTGPRAGRGLLLMAQGRRRNARRVLFARHHGRRPSGYVMPTCGEPDCTAGAHLADAVMRAAGARRTR
ncbi:hypothetical protein [Streptomyces sp. NPDC048242]|uniref:hypothetical protein n=1 Tax=Streptomyces sp. NPDC048242 TaxID=3155026 RepID=UPI00343378F6